MDETIFQCWWRDKNLIGVEICCPALLYINDVGPFRCWTPGLHPTKLIGTIQALVGKYRSCGEEKGQISQFFKDL